MKKLLILLTIAGSLTLVGMDTSDDKTPTKRKLDGGEPEVSQAKRKKPDSDTQVDAKKREEARERVFTAIKIGDLTELQAALTYKPDIETPYTLPDAKYGEDVGTALQYALSNESSLPIIQTLIEHGANPNVAHTRHCWPPLVFAIDKLKGPMQLHCVKALLMAKANPNAVRRDTYSGTTKMTSLHRVMYNDALEEENVYPLCKMLLEHGAVINAKTSTGETPIMVLCDNIQDKIHDKTSLENVLTFMMKYQPLSLMRFLLNAGADITIKDDEGNTPTSILLPQRPLKDVCRICIIDHTKSIRTAHKTMLEFLQKHATERTEDLQVILTKCNRNYWPRGVTHIVADYWLGDTSTQTALSPSSLNGSSSTELASSESAPSGSLAMQTDTTLSLDQENRRKS